MGGGFACTEYQLQVELLQALAISGVALTAAILVTTTANATIVVDVSGKQQIRWRS
jgi:hypothetical protein